MQLEGEDPPGATCSDYLSEAAEVCSSLCKSRTLQDNEIIICIIIDNVSVVLASFLSYVLPG